MENSWIPLLTGFFGAVIGSATAMVTLWIQGRAAARRDRWQLAAQFALEDRRLQASVVEKEGGGVLPISVYIAHHLKIVEAIDEGRYTAEFIQTLTAET